MQDDRIIARRALVKKQYQEMYEIQDLTQRAVHELEILQYQSEINDTDGKLLHKRMWNACDKISCPHITVY